MELTYHRPARVSEIFGDVNFAEVRQVGPKINLAGF